MIPGRARVRRALREACIARAPGLFARTCTPDDRELGLLGEEVAARHLARRGWRILGRRLVTRAGEVDILALAGSRRVCVEVKSGRRVPLPVPASVRSPGPSNGSRELHPALRPGRRADGRRVERQARIARLLGAERVDLVEVLLDPRTRRLEVIQRTLAGGIR